MSRAVGTALLTPALAAAQHAAPGLKLTTSMAREPSAGLKHGHPGTSLGRQSLSTRPSSPGFSLGPRATDTVVVTPAGTIIHRKTEPPLGQESEAQSGLNQTMFQSPQSRVRNLPRFSFGKEKRFNQKVYFEGAVIPSGLQSPGPVHYQVPSPTGNEGPRFSFPKEPRHSPTSADGGAEGGSSPGPGQYHSPTAGAGVGKQVRSEKRSAPQFKFGTGSRDDAQKLYLAFAEGDGELNQPGGRGGPGPGQYGIPSSVGGAQAVRPSSPSFSFGGRGVRRASASTGALVHSAVGPGSYAPAPAIGKQVRLAAACVVTCALR